MTLYPETKTITGLFGYPDTEMGKVQLVSDSMREGKRMSALVAFATILIDVRSPIGIAIILTAGHMLGQDEEWSRNPFNLVKYINDTTPNETDLYAYTGRLSKLAMDAHEKGK